MHQFSGSTHTDLCKKVELNCNIIRVNWISLKSSFLNQRCVPLGVHGSGLEYKKTKDLFRALITLEVWGKDSYFIVLCGKMLHFQKFQGKICWSFSTSYLRPSFYSSSLALGDQGGRLNSTELEREKINMNGEQKLHFPDSSPDSSNWKSLWAPHCLQRTFLYQGLFTQQLPKPLRL